MTIHGSHYRNATALDPSRRRRVTITAEVIARRPFSPDYTYATYRRHGAPRVRSIPSVSMPLLATAVPEVI